MSREKIDRIKNFCKELLPYVVVIIIVVLVKRFIASPIIVNGDSMMNTLHSKDVMILDRMSYRTQDIKRFDIVVVDEGDEYIIKRVIGLPGERITCIKGEIYINDKKIKDSHGFGVTDDFIYEIPDGEYFVLGDNRENSMDSRVFGSFKKSDILGKTKLVLFPFNRIGIKK